MFSVCSLFCSWRLIATYCCYESCVNDSCLLLLRKLLPELDNVPILLVQSRLKFVQRLAVIRKIGKAFDLYQVRQAMHLFSDRW